MGRRGLRPPPLHRFPRDARPKRPSRRRGLEHDHPLRRPAGHPDVVDAAADDLAAVGHQHDLVVMLDREGGDERPVALVDRHRHDAFAAAPGDPVFERRGALAVAIGRDGQDELLGGAHLGIALRRQGRRVAADLLAVAGRDPPRLRRRRPGASSDRRRAPRDRRRNGARIAIEMTRSPSPRAMPRTPTELRPANTRTSVTEKRMHWPPAGGEQHVVGLGAGRRRR